MTIQVLPTLNAVLNASATLLIVGGYVAIKKGYKEIHKKMMIGALFMSALFLMNYLTYHLQVPSRKFPELGTIKTIYLLILVPHIILAAVMVPMVLKTVLHASGQQWAYHKRIARITLPVWLFVSVTGVIVYLMLYRWFV